MTEFELYVLTSLDSIKSLLIIVAMISAGASIMLGLARRDLKLGSTEEEKSLVPVYTRRLIVAIATLICCALASFLIPSTNQMCFIKIAPLLMNNTQVDGDLKQIYPKGIDYIKNQLK